MSRPACRTRHFPAALSAEHCKAAYDYLKENLQWQEGVRSRKGFTRYAKPLRLEEDPMVEELILEGLRVAGGDWEVIGVYANFYENGAHWTPSHSHKGTCQLVVSLGATRTLIVNKKNYAVANGDVVIFGSGAHEVPQEPDVKEGRISLATFMIPKAQATAMREQQAAAELAQVSTLLGELGLA
jgi:hypothetical protein